MPELAVLCACMHANTHTHTHTYAAHTTFPEPAGIEACCPPLSSGTGMEGTMLCPTQTSPSTLWSSPIFSTLQWLDALQREGTSQSTGGKRPTRQGRSGRLRTEQGREAGGKRGEGEEGGELNGWRVEGCRWGVRGYSPSSIFSLLIHFWS